MARIPNIMMNKSGEGTHFCLVPNLTGKAAAFHHWVYVNCSFVIYSIYSVDYILFPLWWFLSINECWILWYSLSASIEIILWFLSLVLLMWCITFIDFQTLNHTCIFRINPIWMWYIILLTCCLIKFADILGKWLHQQIVL